MPFYLVVALALLMLSASPGPAIAAGVGISTHNEMSLKDKCLVVHSVSPEARNDRYQDYVRHPKKHHQIARRRVSSPVVLKEASLIASCTAPVVETSSCQQWSISSAELPTPGYYLFLFRFAVF